MDIRQVSFLTPVRPILSATSGRQSRGVYLRLHIQRSRDGDTWLVKSIIDLAGQAVEQYPPVEVEVLVKLGTVHLPGGRFLPKSRSLFYFWPYNRGCEDSTWPDRGSTFGCQDHPPAQKPPGLPNGRLLPGGYRSRWPVSHQVGPGGFFDRPPGQFDLVKKSYQTSPKTRRGLKPRQPYRHLIGEIRFCFVLCKGCRMLTCFACRGSF